MTETDVPESLLVDDRYQADGAALFDMGYDLVEEDDGTVIITPGRVVDRIDDLPFVGETMEALGYQKVSASPAKAVFVPQEDQ